MSWHAVYLGYFQRGAYEEAANAMRRSIQCNPGFSISYMFLAGVLARLGQIDEARTAAARVLALQPGFGSGEWRAAIDPVPAIGEPLLEGLRLAGLPE
jgi:tetratricopeptide (TPR) repeat protein